MNNSEKIVEYCEENLLPDKLFKNYINNNPSFILTSIKNKQEYRRDISKIYAYIFSQKTFNEKIKQEIINLSKLNEDYIGLKGYFLQCIYYPKDITRLYGDIDILSKEQKGYNFYKKLRKIGYKVQPHYGIYRKIIHGHFLIFLLKTLYTNNNKHIRLKNKESIILELHTNLNDNCSRTTDTKFNTSRMFEESICKNIEGIEYRTLCPVDNILYLMFHSIEHLAFIDLYGTKLSINLQSFYDVAQIACIEDIDWMMFYNRAKEYNIVPFVAIFLKIFVSIYGNIVPIHIVNDLFEEAKKTEFSWKIIFEKMMEMNSSELILGDYKKIPEIDKTSKKACASKEPEKIWKNLCDNKYKC